MRIKKNSILFYLIVAIILFGAFDRTFTYCSLALSMVVLLIVCCERKKSVYVCTGIITLLILQNFCIGIGAHLFHNTDGSLKLLTQIPFISIFIIWFCTCLLNSSSRISKNIKMKFAILLICICFSIFMGFGGILSAIISIRNMTVFFMAYEIGANYIKTKDDLRIFVSHVIRWGELLCIVGIILLVGGYQLYKLIGIHEVYIAKAAPFTEGHLDYRFYTSLFSSKSYVRMGSLFYEPINVSYFFAASLLCSIFNNPYTGGKKLIAIFLNGLGLLLTFGKGGYMIAGLGIVFVCAEQFLTSVRKKIGKRITSFIIISTIFLATLIFIIYYINNIGLAVLNHIWGVIGTWKNVIMRPLGYGIGTGGNVAQTLGNSNLDWLSTGGETAFMSFMFQIGIQGMLAFCMCWLGMSKDMHVRETLFEKLFYYIPFILLGISVLQDNTFTPQCVTVFMLLQGALCNRNALFKKENSI